MAVVELEIPARSAYLSLVRLVVDAAVGSLAPGVGAARLDDLKIAVTEACSNAIEAHEAADADGPVVVRCTVDDDQVTVEVVDRGRGSTPTGSRRCRRPPTPAASATRAVSASRSCGRSPTTSPSPPPEGGTRVSLTIGHRHRRPAHA